MDTFTRNYSIAVGILIVGLLALFLYEDPGITQLNDRLHADITLASYPYRFRVVRIEQDVAVMSTPRSAQYPAYKALGLMDPALENLAQDDPRLMAGQLELARVQEHARRLVIDSGKVSRVSWELDVDWLTRQGVAVSLYQ